MRYLLYAIVMLVLCSGATCFTSGTVSPASNSTCDPLIDPACSGGIASLCNPLIDPFCGTPLGVCGSAADPFCVP